MCTMQRVLVFPFMSSILSSFCCGVKENKKPACKSRPDGLYYNQKGHRRTVPPPRFRKLLRRFREGWDGVISFCFSAKKSHSLVVILQKKHGKRNGLNDNHCKGKEVFIAILEPMDYISTPLGSGGKGGEKSGNLQLGVKETLNKSSAAG